MQGPGRYDAICTAARESAMAEGAILVILNGQHGNGFSVQVPVEMQALLLPKLLRLVADEIEQDLQPSRQKRDA